MTREKRSRRLASLRQGFGRSSNNSRLVMLIKDHPEISRNLKLFAIPDQLDSAASGEFCEATQAAVIEFQKDKGLLADGIVGRKTWLAMGHNLDELLDGEIHLSGRPDPGSGFLAETGLEGNPGSHYDTSPMPRSRGIEGNIGSHANPS